jgi:hypothetical protein
MSTPSTPFARESLADACRRYGEAAWAAAQMGLQLALGPVLHRWRTRWGASDAEVRRPLPGDDLVPEPDWSYTHAITIDAPRAAVWPWLLQIGQGRGGFYSYEALENLVGCDIHNVPELRPALQDLQEGDVVRMHRSGVGPTVIELDAGRALVLGGDPDAHGSRATWSFHLVELPGGRTRLIERGRNVAGRGLLAQLGFGPYLVDPIGFVMSRQMLRTIKRLAEAHAATAAGRRSSYGAGDASAESGPSSACSARSAVSQSSSSLPGERPRATYSS